MNKRRDKKEDVTYVKLPSLSRDKQKRRDSGPCHGPSKRRLTPLEFVGDFPCHIVSSIMVYRRTISEYTNTHPSTEVP